MQPISFANAPTCSRRSDVYRPPLVRQAASSLTSDSPPHEQKEGPVNDCCLPVSLHDAACGSTPPAVPPRCRAGRSATRMACEPLPSRFPRLGGSELQHGTLAIISATAKIPPVLTVLLEATECGTSTDRTGTGVCTSCDLLCASPSVPRSHSRPKGDHPWPCLTSLDWLGQTGSSLFHHHGRQYLFVPRLARK